MKKNEIRNKIISTAESLFKNSDYEDISIRQVASLSEISIGAFYRCINSKEELFEHLYTKFRQDMHETLSELTKDKNPLENIQIFFDTYINYIIKYNYKFSSFFITLALEKPNMILSSENSVILNQYIKEAFEDNIFNEEFSQEHISNSLITLFMGSVLNWCFSMGKSNIKNDFSSAFYILIDKFRT